MKKIKGENRRARPDPCLKRQCPPLVKPPDIEAPLELRAYHSAPPASITVYPPEYFMKKRP